MKHPLRMLLLVSVLVALVAGCAASVAVLAGRLLLAVRPPHPPATCPMPARRCVWSAPTTLAGGHRADAGRL